MRWRPAPRRSPAGALWAIASLALASALTLAQAAPAAAAPLGAAFLDSGFGARAAGLGGALTAVADGPAAVFYNPAGLAASQGRGLLATVQPMSLERTHAGLAGFMNLRGGLAFGLAWLHAGVGGLQARSGSGEVVPGGIDDANDAFVFGLGLNPSPRLQLGLGVKVVRQRLDVPQAGASSADGHGVDLGLRYRVRDNTVVALTARNLADKLSWTVARPSAQTSTSEEALPTSLTAGLSCRWRHVATAAADVEAVDTSDGRLLRGHLGAELRINELLTLRAGVHRLGDADGAGLPSFGLTLRPMRQERLQVHYAWVADDLDAGARTVLTLSSRF